MAVLNADSPVPMLWVKEDWAGLGGAISQCNFACSSSSRTQLAVSNSRA